NAAYDTSSQSVVKIPRLRSPGRTSRCSRSAGSVNKLFVVIWSVIIVGAFALTTLTEQFYSIFFIGSGIGYLALILTMIYLGKCLRNVKSI
ncbi:MAG: hypothetical protein KH626_09135, partial [Clostridium celatum]|nr:hypothetical protein [Clostridium celatum]